MLYMEPLTKHVLLYLCAVTACEMADSVQVKMKTEWISQRYDEKILAVSRYNLRFMPRFFVRFCVGNIDGVKNIYFTQIRGF